jgi:uncharacterized cupin superfamily protein
MATTIKTISKATFEPNSNMDGWIVTGSGKLSVNGETYSVQTGDRISFNGDVSRGSHPVDATDEDWITA